MVPQYKTAPSSLVEYAAAALKRRGRRHGHAPLVAVRAAMADLLRGEPLAQILGAAAVAMAARAPWWNAQQRRGLAVEGLGLALGHAAQQAPRVL